MTYTTSTYPVHAQDEERARLRERNEQLRCELNSALEAGRYFLAEANGLRRDRDILSRKLDEETRKHAATLEELRGVRAQLASAQRFGGLLRRASDRREPCGCPVDLRGAVVPSHECPRHGRLAQWIAADGG